MTTWPELEFVVRVDEEDGGQARVPVLQQQHALCTGWEEIVFEVADDEALD